MIESVEPEICTKMLRNSSEKLGAKLLATTLCHFVARIARLDDAFSEILEPKASPVEDQSLQQKIRKGEKGKAIKKIEKTEKPKDVGHFLVQKNRFLRMPKQKCHETRC